MKKILSLVMILLAISSTSVVFAETTYSQWYNFGMGQLLPNPSEVFEREIESTDHLRTNEKYGFSEELENVSIEECEKYEDACIAFGFKMEERIGTDIFAKDSDGHELYISYNDPNMNILLY